MLVYKVVNVFGGNVTDRYIDAGKINEMAKDNWKLVNITTPPNSHNNRFVCGTFVRDEAVGAKDATTVVKNTASVVKNATVEEPKRGPGRPPKVQESEVK
jgi:hypothetical protein